MCELVCVLVCVFLLILLPQQQMLSFFHSLRTLVESFRISFLHNERKYKKTALKVVHGICIRNSRIIHILTGEKGLGLLSPTVLLPTVMPLPLYLMSDNSGGYSLWWLDMVCAIFNHSQENPHTSISYFYTQVKWP